MANAEGPAPGSVLTVADVHHLLEKERQDRGELSYEQKLALEHATAFDRLGGVQKARKLQKELLALGGRMTPTHAAKILDVCPSHPDEVEVIFAKERQALTKDEVEAIIKAVSTYL